MAAFRAWGRYALGAAAAVVIGVVAFGWKQPVPGLDQFDLGMHELGHLLAGFMPRMFMFLAGSVVQVAVPLGLAAYFGFRRKDGASAGFCLAWAGTSARDVAVYVADAPVQALPLIGGGTHDWAYLLGPQGFDCIDRAGAIARSVELLGLLMVIGGVGVCLWPPAFRLWDRKRVQVAPVARALQPRDPAADSAGDPWLAAARLPFSAGSRAGVEPGRAGRDEEPDGLGESR
jgi:hypothetical protein